MNNSAPSARKLTVVSEAAPEGLMFEDAIGQPQLVSGEAIATLFALFADQVECGAECLLFSHPGRGDLPTYSLCGWDESIDRRSSSN